jgi:hypothetical protein
MDGGLMFFPYFVEGFLFWGLWQTYMDRPVSLVMEYLSKRTLLRNMEGAPLPGTLRER